MTGPEVLKLAKEALAAGKYQYTGHSIHERMDDRGVRVGDIKRAIRTAQEAVQQPNGTWRLKGGLDTDENELVVVIDIKGDTFHIVSFFA